MQRPWFNLTTSQLITAKLLGYVEDVWAGCPFAPCLERFDYVRNKYPRSLAWLSMKLSQRQAWQLLGHTEELWERGRNPSTMQLRWDELAPEQKDAATFLGHSPGTWQGCNEDWTAPVIPGTNVTLPSTTIPMVRARMTIERSFTAISGNIYGSQVATLPTSFVQVFERSVARALFCGNPAFSPDPASYLDAQGEALCILQEDYNRQRNRIRVLTVNEGSIIVEFTIGENQTIEDPSAATLFETLSRQMTREHSPLKHDAEFSYYSQAASVVEIPLSPEEYAETQKALQFEQLRSKYDVDNACELYADMRNGPVNCPRSPAVRSHLAAVYTAFVLVACSFASSVW